MVKSNVDQDLLINIFFIGLIVCAWLGGDYLTKQLNQLPIKELPKPTIAEKIIDIKTLYPVLVEFSKKADISSPENEQSVDAVFGKQEELKKVIVPPVDYVALAKSTIVLDAVSNQGAFINGKFFKRGDVITSATIQDGTAFIKPILTSIDNHSVRVSIGRSSFQVRLTK